ncbi:hypothetical protein NMY22_g9482 [Coprinellus aureogranulatus]|nr:hypothetical protein NMY22_g9482 [Coprinellus aureogranulatus]
MRHSERLQSLDNLAYRLSQRLDFDKKPEDLEEAIQLRREELALRPKGHPDRSKTLNSLAYFLRECFKEIKSFDDLEESLQMYREALEIDTEGHPYRYNAFWGIGRGLFERFQHKKNVEDLREAIEAVDRAVERCPGDEEDRDELLADASTYAAALAAWSAENGEAPKLLERIAESKAYFDVPYGIHPQGVWTATDELSPSISERSATGCRRPPHRLN